jgi:hypothetical protein
LQNLELSISEQDALRQSLSNKGYRWRAEGQTWLITLQDSQP